MQRLLFVEGEKMGGSTCFIGCRENVATASWQESTLTPKTLRERERESGKANKA